jgi:hypothetical protein
MKYVSRAVLNPYFSSPNILSFEIIALGPVTFPSKTRYLKTFFLTKNENNLNAGRFSKFINLDLLTNIQSVFGVNCIPCKIQFHRSHEPILQKPSTTVNKFSELFEAANDLAQQYECEWCCELISDPQSNMVEFNFYFDIVTAAVQFQVTYSDHLS